MENGGWQLRNDMDQRTGRMDEVDSTPALSILARFGYDSCVPDYRFTPYFENEVLRKRPYITKAMCIRVLETPLRVEPQGNDRFRFWAAIEELGGRYLRVVTLSDKLTIHNAFPDRRFKP